LKPWLTLSNRPGASRTANLGSRLIQNPLAEAAADCGVVHDLVGVQDVVEQAGRIEHLEARLEAHPETVRRAARFDRAERHAFHHRGKLAELVRRVDLELDAPARPRFDAGLERLVIFVHHVVDGRQRQLHGELLRAQRRGGEHACRRDCDESAGETRVDRVHVCSPPSIASQAQPLASR